MYRLFMRATWRTDRARLLTAFVSVIGSAALLAWTLGLSFTTWHQGEPLVDQMMGEWDCWVSTARAGGMYNVTANYQRLTYGSPYKVIPAEVVSAVQAHPDVAEVIPTSVYRCQIDYRPDGRIVQGGGGFVGGLADVSTFATCPYAEGLASGRWPKANATEYECVLSPRTFTRLGDDIPVPPVGSLIKVVANHGLVTARIVGYLSASTRMASGFPSMFASHNLAQVATFTEAEAGYNLLMIRLKLGASTDGVAQVVRQASPDDDSANMITRPMLLKQVRTDAIDSLLQQVPLLLVLACLSAGCLIYNILSIGIRQRQQLFMRLRALGLSLSQLKRIVIAEAGLIAAVGYVGGLIIGCGALYWYVAVNGDLFPDGLSVTIWTPIAVALLLGASVAIGLVKPLKQVAVIYPCEARGRVVAPNTGIGQTLFGVALLMPLVVAAMPFNYPVAVRGALLFLVGVPCHFMGLKRLMPAILRLAAWLGRGVLGRLCGIHPRMIQHLFTAHADLASRMAFTLTVGLGAFVAVHIWGATLTKPFVPSENLPDAVVSLMPQGVQPGVEKPVSALSDVASAIPFTSNQYVIAPEDFAKMEAYNGATLKQNNVLLLGTDLRGFFGKSVTVREPNGCVITAMLARYTGLAVGDRFSMVRKDRAGKTLTQELVVEGCVEMNWHLFTARARLRARNSAPMGTLSPVFVSEALAKAWDPEHTQQTSFLWLNFSSELHGQALYDLSDRVEGQIQQIANMPRYQVVDPTRHSRADKKACNAQIHLRNEISEGTLMHSADLVGALAEIPFWSLALLSIGFVAMLTASVRLMKPALTVMRAVGMTRQQFFSLLMSLAILTTVTAMLLSLVSGTCLGWSFTAMTRASMSFGGLPSMIEIPWMQVTKGCAFALFVTLVVAPWPIAAMVKKFQITKRVD